MTEQALQQRRAYQKKWRESNVEHIRQYAKRWRAANKDKVMAAQARYWERKAAAAEQPTTEV